jgi:trehalose synthase
LVLTGEPEFFAITKRVHNLLHGDPGDGGSLSQREQRGYERVLRSNLDEMLGRLDSNDIVMLHDPQTAGMVEQTRARGVRVVWRCHVGRDTPNHETGEAWAFLRPYVENADAFVFSRVQYVPDWVDRGRLVVIPPSIDPLSTKNRELDAETILRVLTRVGLLGGAASSGSIRFGRRNGSAGAVRRHTNLISEGRPPPADARLIVQVSRWDRLKDMGGVLTAFASMVARATDNTHLMLAGPDVSGVADDPEGAQVLAECRAKWSALPASIRSRIHLACVPMDDADENAIIVNALQRHAFMVVQKSLVEGFGLTVTEAMWKTRPVIASRVGGIQDQIVDGSDGLLIDDPADLDALVTAMTRLVDDPDLAVRLGLTGRARVRDQYLVDRHLIQYAELFARLVNA